MGDDQRRPRVLAAVAHQGDAKAREFVCRDLDPVLSRRIEALEPQLGPAGRRVLGMITDQPVLVLAESALEIAKLARTSDATVVRTVQALGFDGLPELKQALRQSLLQASTPAEDLRRTLRDLEAGGQNPLELVLRAHERAIAQLAAPSNLASLQAAADLLGTAARVVVCGSKASASLALYASVILARVGCPSRSFDDPSSGPAEQLFDLMEGDVLLLLAPGRSSEGTLAALRYARRHAVPVILLADGRDGELAKHAQVTVAIPCGSPGHMTLRASMLAALEALCLSLAASHPKRAVSSLLSLEGHRAESRDPGGLDPVETRRGASDPVPGAANTAGWQM